MTPQGLKYNRKRKRAVLDGYVAGTKGRTRRQPHSRT